MQNMTLQKRFCVNFGETEQGQKETSDSELDLARRVMRQIQNNQRQQDH